MLIVEHKIKTKVKPETIWNIWEDVENWNTWDHGLEYSSISGPFREGTPGVLRPKGGPEIKTVLGKIIKNELFIDEARLPLTKITMTHSLKKQGNETIVANKVEMKGFFALPYAFLIGRSIKKNLPHEMAEMIKKAERIEAEQGRME